MPERLSADAGWFPVPDRSMRLRLTRMRMGLSSYLMFLLPLVYAVEHGWMDFGYPGLLLFSAAGLLVNLAFWLAVRSGWSLRLRDPSMTLAQIGASMALALVVIRYAGEARPVLLMLFFTAFFFGIFHLSTRQMLVLAATILVGYALVVVAPLLREGGVGSDALRMELLRFMVLAMVLVWMSLIGGYVGRLRQQLAGALERLRALASHDELTGVYNRRHLMEILAREKERADRYQHRFAVCILDLDLFKAINDTHGHQTGDEVLRSFAQRMRAHTRAIDWLARDEAREEPGAFGRIGGEEFLLVLPHATRDGARHCVERIRQALRLDPIQTEAGVIRITFSAGIAEYRDGDGVQQILARADAALYRAKAGGRDRIEDEAAD